MISRLNSILITPKWEEGIIKKNAFSVLILAFHHIYKDLNILSHKNEDLNVLWHCLYWTICLNIIIIAQWVMYQSCDGSLIPPRDNVHNNSVFTVLPSTLFAVRDNTRKCCSWGPAICLAVLYCNIMRFTVAII